MQTVFIFAWVYLAMIALSFVEAYVEGRNAWDKGKIGWKLKLPRGYHFSAYHFWLFCVVIPVFISLPLVVSGWDLRLFGILVSAYFTGMILEDFVYFIVNPVVGFREFWTDFTDFYPWIKIKGKKIIPVGYVAGVLLAIVLWYFLWR